jgi:hypothetical protein
LQVVPQLSALRGLQDGQPQDADANLHQHTHLHNQQYTCRII